MAKKKVTPKKKVKPLKMVLGEEFRKSPFVSKKEKEFQTSMLEEIDEIQQNLNFRRPPIVNEKGEINSEYVPWVEGEDFVFPRRAGFGSSIDTQSEIINYVRRRLGEPVLTVELSNEQIESFYEISKKLYSSIPQNISKDYWEFEYTTALSMETLGIIHSKIQLPDDIKLNYLELIQNAKDTQFLLRNCLGL